MDVSLNCSVVHSFDRINSCSKRFPKTSPDRATGSYEPNLPGRRLEIGWGTQDARETGSFQLSTALSKCSANQTVFSSLDVRLTRCRHPEGICR